MYKKITSLTVAFIVFFMKASFVLANEENPIRVLRGLFKLNWSFINNFSFLFFIIMIPITILVVGLLAYAVYRTIKHGYGIIKGEGTLKDWDFWARLGIVILIVFLFASGLFFDLLELIYEGLNEVELDSGGSSE
jgi:hypothetical protein